MKELEQISEFREREEKIDKERQIATDKLRLSGNEPIR
jgi:hypothetical protein